MTWAIDWVPLAIAFAASVVATGAVRAWAIRRGQLDEVDPARRLHSTATPRLGGVGIFLGLLGGAPLIVSADAEFGTRFVRTPSGASLIVLAFAFLVGLLDDLRPRQGLAFVAKLLLQGALGVGVVWLVGPIDSRPIAPWGSLELGSFAAPLTAAWVLAVVNVVNFMDGSDAIAGTTAVVILVAAGLGQPTAGGALLLPLAAAMIGFLIWNWPPAKIFMGDGGSHLLGAAIALAPCRGSFLVTEYERSGPPDWTVHGAPWPLAGAALLPSILDVAEALIHKARHGIPMSQAHHDHLYQRLVKASGSHGLVAIRYGVLALLAVLVVGPFAERFGALAASAVGVAILSAHWIDGVRRTRGVPRLGDR